MPNIEMLTSNQTYAAEQLALYRSRREGPYTIVNQGGNTVAFLPLREVTANYQSIIDLANSQSVSSLYPSDSYDSSVLAGYEAQRSLILDLYTSTLTSVGEIGWNGGAVMPITLVKPLSRGSITINSTDVLTSPVIDFGTLTDPSDLEILIAALRSTRALVATPAMQELGPVLELSPGANLTTDQQLRDVLRGLISPTYSHPCCTCAMMPRELGGVVGPDLMVYGVEGLRVVDASVMPLIPATHTSATVYALAEKVCCELYFLFCSSRTLGMDTY
jgi:choline dehydrogenase